MFYNFRSALAPWEVNVSVRSPASRSSHGEHISRILSTLCNCARKAENPNLDSDTVGCFDDAILSFSPPPEALNKFLQQIEHVSGNMG